MTNEQIREGFNELIKHSTDPDRIARLEVAREYWTNPNFAQSLSDVSWQAQVAKAEHYWFTTPSSVRI